MPAPGGGAVGTRGSGDGSQLALRCLICLRDVLTLVLMSVLVTTMAGAQSAADGDVFCVQVYIH